MKSFKMNEFKNYIKKIERILIRKRKYCQKTLLLRKKLEKIWYPCARNPNREKHPKETQKIEFLERN